MSIRRILISLVLPALVLASLTIASNAWASPPTPLRSYTPSSGVQFKTAASCYDARDMYVVAAVFTVPYGTTSYDAVYHLRIQGNSAASNYGELVSSTWIRSEWRIDNIDCASSGGGNVFIAFDRKDAGAIWYRVDNTAVTGPFTMGNCEGLYAARPRIAYGGGRVMIAYEGNTYTGAAGSLSCGVCSQQFSQAGSSLATNVEFWRESIHLDYDTEWNGSQFMLAVQWQCDGWSHDDWALSTLRYNSVGSEVAENLVQYFSAGASPAPGSRLKLTYSANAHNPTNAMFLQTNTASYWLNTSGVLVGAELPNNVGTGFVACEYWGADNAAATLFSPYLTWTYEGIFPTGHFVAHHQTHRAHLGLSSAPAYETSFLNPGYVPHACEAAMSYTDGEVMLISKRGTPDANMYWNLQPSD